MTAPSGRGAADARGRGGGDARGRGAADARGRGGGDTQGRGGADARGRGVANLRLGRAAERVAASHLETRGWRVLGRNVRVGRGELDLIVRRGSVLAFVEVKARRTRGCGAPEDAVSPAKQHQVARLAELWLAPRPWALGGVTDVRFDIVAVDLTTFPAQVRHLPAAFTAD